MQNLCEYAEEKKSNNAICLKCKKNGNYCGFQRYCIEERCLKMRNTYTICKVRLNDNGEKT